MTKTKRKNVMPGDIINFNYRIKRRGPVSKRYAVVTELGLDRIECRELVEDEWGGQDLFRKTFRLDRMSKIQIVD